MFPLLRSLLCLCLLTATASAAAPFRLWEIGTAKFVERAPGQVWLERGLLTAEGQFRVTDESPVLSTVDVPVAARGKILITLDAWLAYERLGTAAVANFIADTEGAQYTIGQRQYIDVRAHPEAKLDVGNVVNISTRGLASLTNKLIGGFIVEGHPRWVLIRAVGPGLVPHGVTDALADPYLTIFKSTTPHFYSDDWHKRPDKDQIREAAARVGAFPLGETSKDAALLIELPPGAYTAHVEPESGGPGTALVEIYILP